MSSTLPFVLVDAFTDRPFAGNPAVVCLLPAWRADAWLQAVAREMNQSETAFLVRNAEGFDLRWLTPQVEVDLCGHATLASSHVLWQQGHARPEEAIRFSTRSGILKSTLHGPDIELDFPLEPATPASPPPGLLTALGVSARYVGRNRFDYLVEVESEAILRQLAPDFKLLATVQTRGVIVTSRAADPRFDFVSRFFAPAEGIDEDPVTGSAHCCLGDFWRRRLGKDALLGRGGPGSGGRGSSSPGRQGSDGCQGRAADGVEKADHDTNRQGAGPPASLPGCERPVCPGRRRHALFLDDGHAPLAGAG
jgi:PhzF family phenazine biosynthesis protein